MIMIILCRQWTTKEQISLRRCAGWSAPLLFTHNVNIFSHYTFIRHPDKSVYLKIIFSYFSSKTYVVGTQKNLLNEISLLSTLNTCINCRMRKYSQFYSYFFVSLDLRFIWMILYSPCQPVNYACDIYCIWLREIDSACQTKPVEDVRFCKLLTLIASIYGHYSMDSTYDNGGCQIFCWVPSIH